MNLANKQLTKFEPGSIMELWTIAFPLMLTALSANLMMFVDRIILSHYSIESMNAAAASGIATSIFIYGALGAALICEVFVGQYNGANNTKRLVIPVWQMLWFSIATSIVMWPLAVYGGACFIPESLEEQGVPYFRWIMFFGPLVPMTGAISSFFVGQGKTRLTTMAALVANVFNAILSYLFVFGIDGVLVPLGTKGAAIATGISETIQVLLLAIVFFDSENRRKFNTHKPVFDWPEMKECLRIGIPSSLSHLIEIVAWTVLFHITTSASQTHTAILAIGQSMYVLFAFFNDGLSRGVSAVASNYIDRAESGFMNKVLRSSLSIHLFFMFWYLFPMVVFPHFVVDVFLPDYSADFDIAKIEDMSTVMLFFVWLSILFDGGLWSFGGILTAGGDTKFVAVTNGLNAWVVGIFPMYIALHYLKVSPDYVWAITAFYVAVNMTCFGLRYKSGKWIKLKLHKPNEV